MAQLFGVHPVDPQVRSLRQAAQILDHGGVGAIPTDSCYALACHLDDDSGMIVFLRGCQDIPIFY